MMGDDRPHIGATGKAPLTGHDLGVLVCRALAIWVFVLGYQSISSPLIQNFVWNGISDSARGMSGAAMWFVVTLLIIMLYGAVYVATGLVLWRRAGSIADRMLGASYDRVLESGFTVDTALRTVIVGIGLWLGIPALINLVILLIQFFVGMATFDGEGGIREFLISDNSADGGRMLLSYMLNPGAYLLGSLICIFRAGSITRFLLRLKSVGLNPDDNAE